MGPVHADDLEWTELTQGTMNARRKQLSEAADGEQLGCSLYELPAGNESWPYHYHAANEEAMYVLAGTGTLRLADEMYDLEAGDYVSFPADERGGHKVINDSETALRYLLISTMNEPDVTVYPDSEKFGVYVGSPPGGREERSLSGYYPIDGDVDYWDGE
ncbi:cupin [Halostagnicola sp. A56]|uniref:cupin domain-containing protein n=1 Tax=Halostagnicola sp. A56 TaxID=1495067 RepID=UPI00049F205D|nr:cupin domain-containing protein [Halostagnicola sp. A56]KDE57463.1 cupin [Halostagnicola sp. A56]